MRRALALLLAVSLTACSSVAPVSVREPAFRDQLGTVVVRTSAQAPALDFDRALGGAASQRKQAFEECMRGAVQGCGEAGLFALHCFAVGLAICGAIGAASGSAASGSAASGSAAAADAPQAAARESAGSALSDALQPWQMQESIRGRIESLARDYGVAVIAVPPAAADAPQPDPASLAGSGADTLIEVALVEAGMQRGVDREAGSLIRQKTFPLMTARIRALRTRDGEEMVSATRTLRAKERDASDWIADSGGPLLEAMSKMSERIARDLAEYVFALYPFPDPEGHPIGAGQEEVGYGLLPVRPTRDAVGPVFHASRLLPTVDSLQPTIEWQAFPRQSDIDAAPEAMHRVTDVRYDLHMIGEGDGKATVYRRDGLPDTVHVVDSALRSGAWHRWTVRARFVLDGRQRVTPWAQSAAWVFPENLPLGSATYKFRTP